MSIRNITLSFGKFKGKTVDEVAETDAGRDYILWCAKNLKLYGVFGDCIRFYADAIVTNKIYKGEMKSEAQIEREQWMYFASVITKVDKQVNFGKGIL